MLFDDCWLSGSISAMIEFGGFDSIGLLCWLTVSMQSTTRGIRQGYLSINSRNAIGLCSMVVELSEFRLESARYLFLWRRLFELPIRCEWWRGEAKPNLFNESECQPSQLFWGSLKPALLLAPCQTSLLGLIGWTGWTQLISMKAMAMSEGFNEVFDGHWESI